MTHEFPPFAHEAFITLAKLGDDRALVKRDRRLVIATQASLRNKLRGAVAELGVYRGGTARIIANSCPCKTCHLYDTFEGIPYDDKYEEGHRKGDFAVDFEEVKEYLSGCPNVVYHKGIFPATAVDEDYCFVHVDADIYETTEAAIKFFIPRLVPGGCIIFDDYRWESCPGVQAAIENSGLDVMETAPFQCIYLKTRA